MNSPTITMEPEEAQDKLDTYQQAMRENPKLATRVDKHLMKGFRLLARGRRLIDVNEAIRHGGIIDGKPRIAIARADAMKTYWSRNDQSFWWGTHSLHLLKHAATKWELPTDTFPLLGASWKTYTAIAPCVPLPLRPKEHLRNYFLLWEANWTSVPRDPYLLRPVFGSIMAIVAEWDLTPLEMAAAAHAQLR